VAEDWFSDFILNDGGEFLRLRKKHGDRAKVTEIRRNFSLAHDPTPRLLGVGMKSESGRCDGPRSPRDQELPHAE